MPLPRRTVLALLASLAFGLGSQSFAQGVSSGQEARPLSSLTEESESRLSTDLLLIHHAHEAHIAARPAEPFVAANAIGQPVSDYVTVDAVARGGDAAALLAELEALGLRYGSAYGAVVSGRLPVVAIAEAAHLSRLGSLSTSLAMTLSELRGEVPSMRTGSITGESDRALRANVARTNHNVSGAGIRIGVLSDSYDNLDGAARDIASGDLPSDVMVLQEFPADDEDSQQSDEGRAMMQLAYNIAPGASFAFYSAFLGQANFANGIRALADDSQVIVDDVIYFAEPMFQDGIIAQAVDGVVAQGRSYFSAAGNSGDASYESPFRSSGVSGTFTVTIGGEERDVIGELHDFDPSATVTDPYHRVILPNEGRILMSFQWDQPFLAADPIGETGSASRYDILLVDAERPTASVVAFSVDNNIASGNPVEILDYTNETGESRTLYVVIVHRSGPEAGLMKWVDFRAQGNYEYAPRDRGVSTSYGHANSAGAFAVGASAWFNTPVYNENIREPVVNRFSSFGGVPILFSREGDRLATPVDRLKPDAVGSDGDSNTFFGGDATDDGLPNFFGTSAAAPNVAGVAALMLEADRWLTPAQVYEVLRATATDIANIDGRNPLAAPGYDRRSGFGFVRADEAVARALVVSTEPEAASEVASLSAAFPNPFRGEATLSLSVERTQHVRAAAYDVLGRQVVLLHDGLSHPEAPLTLTLSGEGLATGVYFVRVVGETFAATQPVTLTR